MIRTRTRTRTQPRHRRLMPLLSLLLALGGLTVLAGSPASAADVGYKGPYYGQAAGTTGGSVPGSPTAQKPQSKLWFAHGSWWGALWSETNDNTAEAFTIQRYDWGANQWVDTGVKLETRSRSDLDVLWDGSHLYVASNSDASAVPAHSVEVARYAYAAGTWTLDWEVPVVPVVSVDSDDNAYVYSPVIEKDSTGMLWMTYTKADKVMVTHSTAGNEQSWVAPYVLPTPAGESTISYNSTADPNQPSSDIASIVSYDGNKIGVLWSNQSRDTVYWASHNDGAGENQWSTEVAFTAPEGADDHISLKSVLGTDGGRVYAVTKTSMNGAEPIFEVLVLRLNGEWDSFPYASASTNLTRPIIMLHPGNRELYVFAAAGETASSGGVIYYKKTSMTNPDFGSLDSRGSVFIADDGLTADANTERINNPSSTKQNVNATTGLLVVANNDPTDYYYYNRMDLADDTTAPETTITGQPLALTTETTAGFSFTSNEAGSTFECKLDAGAFAACTSPMNYTGLAVGQHTFSVRAKDAAGYTDATPASYTWTVSAADTTAPETTITRQPLASTTATTADFEFTSTEAGSTFECKLDTGAYGACISPKSYAGLAAGQHTFSVRAKDAAGSTDASPASYTWTVTTTPQAPTATPVFSDDFSSGGFAAGGWRVSTRKADALVMDGALHGGDDGAVLRTRSALRSHATLSKTLGSQHRRLQVEWSALVSRDGGDGRLSRLVRIRDNSGRVVLTLLRAAGNGRLQVKDLHGTVTTAGRLPLDRVREIVLVLEQRRGRDVWRLSLNGKVVAADPAARTGGRALRGVTFGSNTGRILDYRIDDVEVWAP